MTARCLKCGADIEGSGSGRPPIYCSTGCRRAAEHEVRRINRVLENLEHEEREYRRGFETDHLGGASPKHVAKQHAWVKAEISSLEQRLTKLLSPEGG